MSINNPIHKQIIKSIKKLNPNKPKNQRLWVQKYLGSNKETFCIRSSEIDKLAKRTIKENQLDNTSLISLIDSLYRNATTFEEMMLAARLISFKPKSQKSVNPIKLNTWLNYTHGWTEVDVLCQNNFSAEEILKDIYTWKKLLTKFNKDKNIHKRRASLVLLVKAVRQSDNPKLSKLALSNTTSLLKEKEVLITKAVSWILRSLIKNHKQEVINYLKQHRDSIPKIAMRETQTKLATGRKTPKTKIKRQE